MSHVRQHIMLLGAGLLALLASASPASPASLGDFITPCKAKDPNVNECVRLAAQELFQKAAHGIPELGIRPLEHVTVPKLDFSRQGGPMNMDLQFTNSTHSGLGDLKVKSARVDPNSHVYNFTVLIPKYVVSGMCDIKGRIVVLPINGHYKSNLTFTDIEADWHFTGEPEQRDGKTYLKLNKLTTAILPDSPKNVHINFDGLFGGNKLLGDTMNDFLNTNWHEVAKQLKPNVQSAFDHRMLPLAQRFVSHFPMNQLFSDL